jgi:hypothetical protein
VSAIACEEDQMSREHNVMVLDARSTEVDTWTVAGAWI